MGVLIGFEAKGIQPWILAGGRLRDLAGGSEAVETLATTFLRHVLIAAEIPVADEDDGSVPRITGGQGEVLSAAAGAFRVHISDEDRGKRLARLLPAMAERWAPGLRVCVAWLADVDGSAVHAKLEDIRRRLQRETNLPTLPLPPAGPLVLRSQRTAGAVVGLSDPNEWGNGETPEAIEAVDAGTARRRAFALAIRPGPGKKPRPSVFKRRLAPEAASDFALEMDEIASAGGGNMLALIHADGNGFGQMLLKLKAAPLKETEKAALYAELSTGIREITTSAVRFGLAEAIPDIIERTVPIPARPVVVGGDDVTILLPARLGLPFAGRFLKAFAFHGKALLDEFRSKWPLCGDVFPSALTACAGIAFVKDHYPFDQGYELAESLCKVAKKGARRKGHTASALAFHRVTTTTASTYDEIVDRELTVHRDGTVWSLTCNPYTVGKAVDGLFRFEDLECLAKAVGDLPHGAWRELATLCRENDRLARSRFRRLIEVAREKAPDAAERVSHSLSDVFGCEANGFAAQPAGGFVTPILDVTTLLAIDRTIGNVVEEHAA